MPLDPSRTIAAIASPPGAALRGIVRISGQDALDVVARVFHPSPEGDVRNGDLRPVRRSGYVLISPQQLPLPVAVFRWPTRRSYTGQPMAEIHLVGAPPLLEAVLEQLYAAGARPAERGEFTLRAFLAGRIDLTQAEAVIGVIDATDDAELRRALSQLGGGIAARLDPLRHDLIAVLGDLEAGLDFVDEDIEFISTQELSGRLRSACELLTQLIGSSAQRLPSGSTPRIVLAGLPNAGKSTLFNRLVDAPHAIVSATAGTTRDFLAATLHLPRLHAELIDTAGWESAADDIARDAQGLRTSQLESADLIVWCTAVDCDADMWRHDAELRQQLVDRRFRLLPILTCCDRMGPDCRPEAAAGQLAVSSHTEQGLKQLRERIEELLCHSDSSRSELLASTSLRCRDSLQRCRQSLEQARAASLENLGHELIAADIRDALRDLAAVVGEVYTDDILDHIFSAFCIGK